jgi:hypothetical protein
VLAILSAYAIPKLFGLQDQARTTEETLKIKDIEARHAQELLKAGKRGVNPALGDVVGFRPEVVAEPAPDTAPMLMDWKWNSSNLVPAPFRIVGGTVPWSQKYTLPMITAEEIAALPDFRCTNERDFLNPEALDGNVVSSTSLLYHKVNFLSTTLSGPMEDIPADAPAPKCTFIFDIEQFSVASSYGVHPWMGLGLRGVKSHYHRDGMGYNGTSEYYWSGSLVITPISTVSSWEYVNYGGSPAQEREADVSANRYRLDCSSYSSRYGVPYRIKGARHSLSNGLETSAWLNSYQTFEDVRHLDAENKVGFGMTYVNRANTALNGVCERQGPAPVPPPADPGDPGAYSMAADHSGYCLSPGRKLPTYRDSAGTPTSSAADPVVELATEAVDDPTNCP